MTYHDLDGATRLLMLEELAADAARGSMQLSSWLTEVGKQHWVDLLRRAFEEGDDATLAGELGQPGYLELYQTHHRNAHTYRAKVPHTAANLLAEGGFNHYYCRAICRRALDEGNGFVAVYRAKAVQQPRLHSQELIGTLIDAQELLDDLRTHPGVVETALGVPAGPNSGLSVRLPTHRHGEAPGRESVA